MKENIENDHVGLRTHGNSVQRTPGNCWNTNGAARARTLLPSTLTPTQLSLVS